MPAIRSITRTGPAFIPDCPEARTLVAKATVIILEACECSQTDKVAREVSGLRPPSASDALLWIDSATANACSRVRGEVCAFLSERRS